MLEFTAQLVQTITVVYENTTPRPKFEAASNQVLGLAKLPGFPETLEFVKNLGIDP